MAAVARETEGMRAGMAAGRVVGQFPIFPFLVPWPLPARTRRVLPVATAFPLAIASAHDWG